MTFNYNKKLSKEITKHLNLFKFIYYLKIYFDYINLT